MSRAARFKTRSTKEIMLPSGAEVIIRRWSPFELAKNSGQLIVAARTETSEGGLDLTRQADLVQAFLALGLQDPPLWTGTPAECPETHITAADLGEDFWPLIREIMQFNGLAMGVAAAAESFRGGVGGTPGPDREAVRGTPDRPAGPAGGAADVPAGDLRAGGAGGERAPAADGAGDAG